MATTKRPLAPYLTNTSNSLDFNAGQSYLDSQMPQASADPAQAGVLRTAGDVGIKLAQGAVDLGQSVVGLGSLATGGLVGKGMRALGYDPEATNAALGEYLSDSQKAADAKVQAADGVADSIIASIQNPRSILGGIAESAPGMVAGMGVTGAVAKGIGLRAALATTEGRLAAQLATEAGKPASEAAAAALATNTGKAAAKAALEKAETPLLALGSGTEGAQSAGQIADQAQGEGRDYTDYALPSLAAGAGTAGIGLAAGKVFGDAATDMAAGTHTLKGSKLAKIGKEAFSEGVAEEAPQSAQEQYFTNMATGEPDLMKGVGNAAGSGLVVGGAMGAGMAAMHRGEHHASPTPTAAQAGQPTAAGAPPAGPVAPPAPLPPNAGPLERAKFAADTRAYEQAQRTAQLNPVPYERTPVPAAPATDAALSLAPEGENVIDYQGDRDMRGAVKRAPITPLDDGQASAPHYENGVDFTPGPLVEADPETGEVDPTVLLAQIDNRLDALRQIGRGRPAQETVDARGQPKTIPAVLPRAYTPDEEEEYKRLQRERAALVPTTSPHDKMRLLEPALDAADERRIHEDDARQEAERAQAAAAEQQSYLQMQQLKRQAELDAIHGRVEAHQAMQSRNARMDLLDQVLTDHGEASTASKLRAFSARLGREGYRNIAPTDEEIAHAQRHTDAATAFNAPEYSAPNELVDAVPERAAPAPQQAKRKQAAAPALPPELLPLAQQSKDATEFWKALNRAKIPTGQRAPLMESFKAWHKNGRKAQTAAPAASTEGAAHEVQAPAEGPESGQSAAAPDAEPGAAAAEGEPGAARAVPALDAETGKDALSDNVHALDPANPGLHSAVSIINANWHVKWEQFENGEWAVDAHGLYGFGATKEAAALDFLRRVREGAGELPDDAIHLLDAPTVDQASVESPPPADLGHAQAQAAPAESQAANDVDLGSQPEPRMRLVADNKPDDGWTDFPPETGTLGIPRAEMPQIKAEHRGALTQFMLGRGITHEQQEVQPGTLMPTQREFSVDKVEQAKNHQGGDRAILVSKDNHVLDGHHQWLAKMESDEPVRVIRFDAPIHELLPLARDFPSAEVEEGAPAADEPAPEKPSRNSEAWRNEGKTEQQLVEERAEYEGREAARQIAEEAKQDDFNAKELPQALAYWAEQAKVPVDALRQAVLASLDSFDIKKGNKAKIRHALNPTRTAAAPEAPAKVNLGSAATGDVLHAEDGTMYHIDGIDIGKNKIRLTRNPNMLSERIVLMDQDRYNRLVAEDAAVREAAMKATNRPAAEPAPAVHPASPRSSSEAVNEFIDGKRETPPTLEEVAAEQEAAKAPGSDVDPLDAELQAALGHLGDVLGDVFGAKLNMTGPQHGAGDLLPALSKVIELLVRKGFRSFAAAVGASAKAMRGNAAVAPHVDKISPRQWKAAYNAIAEYHEGTDSEEAVAAVPADQVQKLVAADVQAAPAQPPAAQEKPAAPGTRVNGEVEQAAADRLQKLLDVFPTDRDQVLTGAMFNVRGAVEALRKPQSAADVIGLLRTARDRLYMRNYVAQSDVIDAVIEQLGGQVDADEGEASPAPQPQHGFAKGDQVRIKGNDEKLQTVDDVGDDGWVYLKSGLSFAPEKATELLYKSEPKPDTGSFGGSVAPESERSPSHAENVERWKKEGEAPAVAQPLTDKERQALNRLRVDAMTDAQLLLALKALPKRAEPIGKQIIDRKLFKDGDTVDVTFQSPDRTERMRVQGDPYIAAGTKILSVVVKDANGTVGVPVTRITKVEAQPASASQAPAAETMTSERAPTGPRVIVNVLNMKHEAIKQVGLEILSEQDGKFKVRLPGYEYANANIVQEGPDQWRAESRSIGQSRIMSFVDAVDFAAEQMRKIAAEDAAQKAQQAQAAARPPKPTGPDPVLRDSWGVDHIDGYTALPGGKNEPTDYGLRGGVKDAFLKDAQSYLRKVSAHLQAEGYVPHRDRNDKPAKIVSINEGGPAVSGEAMLTMFNPELGRGIYIQVSGGLVSGGNTATRSGVNVMMRVTQEGDRYGKGMNHWMPVNLRASQLAEQANAAATAEARRANAPARTPAAPAEQSSTPAPAEPLAHPAPIDNTEPAATNAPTQEPAHDSTPAIHPVALDHPMDEGQRPLGSDAPARGAEPPRAGDGQGDAGRVREPGGRAEGADDARENLGDGGRDANVSDRPDGDLAAGRGPVPADFHPAPGGLTREGSWFDTASRNVDLIELARKIEGEGRAATPEEQAQLAKYVGFGASAIRNILFPVPNSYAREHEPHRLIWPNLIHQANWRALAERLEALPPEWQRSVLQSSQYAHYTSENIIRSTWNAMQRLGFTGGKVFEPGMGIGSFAMLMPDSVSQTSRYTGVEFDGPTALIAKLLSPQQNVLHDDFIKRKFPKDFFDVAIGNPPFSQTKIFGDPEYEKHGFMLHDFFFAKALDSVRPGGLLAFVTSKGTMDKQSDKARNYLAARADLVGAVRLPSTAFEDNAGTSVVTDVLFLRKRAPGEAPAGESWKNLATVETKDGPTVINEYYAAHPDMVLGQNRISGNLDDEGRRINSNGRGGEKYTVVSYDKTPAELDAKFAAAVERLPQNVYSALGQSADSVAKETAKVDFDPRVKREGVIYLADDGTLMRVEHGVGRPLENGMKMTAADPAWFKGYIGLRDLVQDARHAQVTDGDWQGALQKLNDAYDAFRKQHGPINDFRTQTRKSTDEQGNVIETESRVFKNRRRFREDYDSAILTQLETINEAGEIVKSPFLLGRTIGVPVTPDVKTIGDALAVSLDNVGRLDLDDVARRIGISRDEAIDALGNQVYKTPAGEWQLADEYLSGDVVAKLEEAEQAARLDESMRRNIEALKEAQPEKLGPSQISAKLGASWIPESHVNAFAQLIEAGQVTFDPITESWQVDGGNLRNGRRAGAEYGTAKRSPSELLEAALNSRPVKVAYDSSAGKELVGKTDPTATTAANEAMKKIKDKFKGWIWTDADRASELVEIYNKRYNNIAPRKFDGSHLTLPGVSLRYKLHPHQLRAIWRIIQTGDTYLAHAVGAGKTIEMIAAGMEQKRLGLINKPMYVVPNHMLEQFSNEFMELYPLANIMVADDENFSAERRKAFVASATLNKPDAIIITHDAFQRIGVKEESVAPIRDEILTDLENELEATAKSNDTRVRRSQLEQQIEAVNQRFDRIIGAGGKDSTIKFEDIGADFIFADEAHAYRKLDFHTAQQIKGIDPNGSKRALDMYVKTRWLEQQRPGRAMVFASGTPVTNTMGELYTIMRYFAPEELDRGGISTFDAWARQFGEVAPALEPNAAGKYELIERFAKFDNVPELMSRVRQFMDVLTSDHLGALVKRPDLRDGKPNLNMVPPSEGLKAYMEGELARRIETSKAWKPSKEQPANPDPIVAIITDGRFAAIDPRFFGGKLGPEGSIITHMGDKVVAAYHAGKDNVYLDKDGNPEPLKGSTQIVFYNLGFGEQSMRNRGFDARAAFTKRLTDGGIPRNQIAWFDDADTDAKKEAVFKDMRSGKLRVLIGSAKKMGTGVNVQKRLEVLHYQDPPWFPADVEQPHGRIIRQGNQNSTVAIEWYSTKGTYQSTMWQMVARKQRFIDQAFTGDKNMRSMEDLGEASLFEQAAAVASGDPRALQLAGLKQDVERFERLQAAHASEQIDARSALRSAQWQVERADTDIATYGQAFKLIGERMFNFSTGTVGKRQFDKVGEFGQALKDAFNEVAAGGMDVNNQKIASLGDHVAVTITAEHDDHGQLTGWYKLRMHLGKVTETVVDAQSMGDQVDAVGLARKVINKVNGIAVDLRDAQASKTAGETDIIRLRKKVGAPFEYQQEMAEKYAELKRLEEELKADGQAKPVAPAAPPLAINEDGTTPGEEAPGASSGDGDPDTLMGNARAVPGFYSELQRQVAAVPDKQAVRPADQWASWLQANAGKLGAKKDEIEWSGITDYLHARGKDKVSRDELVSFLGQNGVQVREVVKGEDAGKPGPTVEQLEQAHPEDVALLRKHEFTPVANPDLDGELVFHHPDGDNYVEAHNMRTDYGVDRATEAAARRLTDAFKGMTLVDNTRYGKYTLPGGQNYRELLLTLPAKKFDVGSFNDWHEAKYGTRWTAEQARERRDEYKRLTDEYVRDKEAGSRSVEARNYKSDHWDEPNIVAHVRFDDRTDADGKRVLFIEELQSDWGQEGTKKGFDAEAAHNQAQMAEAGAAARDALAANDFLGFDNAVQAMNAIRSHDDWQDRWDIDTPEQRAAIERFRTMANDNAARKRTGVKPGPFVNDTKDWLSLGIKRMIRYAAENGYDRIAFVNGQQSADRYKLSKQVEEVAYNKGTQFLRVLGKDGRAVFNGTKPESELAAFVGKEMADKIAAGGNFVQLRGLDLNVGGEGMKTFYDKIVPQTANEVLKKLGGGKVGEVQVSMRGALSDDDAIYDHRLITEARNEDYEPGYKTSDGRFFDTFAGAVAHQQQLGTGDESLSTQPGFDITPALREKAMAGMPLFTQQGEHTAAAPFDQRLHDAAANGASATDLLHMIATESENPDNRALAEQMLANGVNPTVGIGSSEGQAFTTGRAADDYAASYSPSAHHVSLYEAQGAERNLMHEFTHAATAQALRAGGRAAMQMKALYADAKRSGKLAGMYGMANVDEFVAEAHANPQFQAALREIPSGARSLWDRFVDIVRSILGLAPAQRDMLGAVMDAGRGLMAEVAGATTGATMANSRTGMIASRVGLHFKDSVKRTPELMEAAKRLANGEIDRNEYDRLVNIYKPVEPYQAVPEPATPDQMRTALTKDKVPKLDAGNSIRPGEPVGIRLDIPAYRDHGVWIVAVHEGKRGGKGGPAGKPISYQSTAHVMNPNLAMAESGALKIAAGAAKNTLATIGGEWVESTPEAAVAQAREALTNPAWVQVGIDPERHSYFYDRITMEPVVSGSEAIQVGGLVLVKNPVYAGKDDFLFAQRDGAARAPVQAAAPLMGNVRGQAPALLDALSTAATNAKDINLWAGYKVGDFLDRTGKVSWWHKTIGTMKNLALRHPAFRPVYEAVQNFLADVSRFATAGGDLAPRLMPQLENLKDIFGAKRKRAVSAEDTKAIARPIFEGTLTWARDAHGNPVSVDELRAQAEALTPDQKAQILLHKGVLDEDQYRRLRALPPDTHDAAIENKFEATQLQAGVVWTDAELRSMFNLNDSQIDLYREFRAAVDKSLTNLTISEMVRMAGKPDPTLVEQAVAMPDLESAAALLRDHYVALARMDPEKADMHLATAAQIMNLADKGQRLIDRGYAPLTRFGKYTVYMQEEDKEPFFGMYEDAADATKMARELKEQFPDAMIRQGTLSEEEYKLFSGVSPETVELFGSMLGLGDSANAADEAYQKYLQLAKANRSAMKRMIHRKGIAGFSEDPGRVLASFLYSNARLTSSNLHSGQIDEAVTEIPKEQGQLKDEAVKLRQHIRDPQSGGTFLSGLMFAQFLGGSVASAAVNFTQPVMTSLPYLSQWGGIGAAGKRLVAAVRDARKDSTGDSALDAALEKYKDVVSPQEVHYMQAQAAGKATLRAGDGTKAGDARAKAHNAMSAVRVAWGKLFAMAEQANRRITFIAAYRTALEHGNLGDPGKFAAQAVKDTQFVANAGNKMAWGRNPVGGLLLTFKGFSIQYLEMLGKMAFAGEPGSPERAAGRRAVLYAMAVMLLMAGSRGLPFEQDIEAVIDGILQRMGYNFSSKRKMHDLLADALGDGGADFVQNGASALPGMPFDMAGRLGAGHLIPGIGALRKKDSYTSDVAEIAGPAGDLVKRGFTAAGKAVGGDVLGAALDLSPQAVRNAAQGVDMLKTGSYRDARGYKINDTTPAEAGMKALGFQPSSTAGIQDAKRDAVDMISQARMRSKEISEMWAQGRANNDESLVNQARAERDDWNEKNPDTKIQISMPGVIHRARAMREDALLRTQQTAGKALKAAVRRELSQANE